MSTKPETAEDFASRVYATVDEEQVLLSLRLLTALIADRDELIRAEGRERIAELEAALEKAQWTAEYLAGYQADLAAIDRALDAVNAPHDPEDGASLSPKRIRLMGERIASLESKLATARAEAREAALGEAEARVRSMNDAFENQGYMYEQAADAIKSLLTSPPPRVDGWAPVSERLPHRGSFVLIADTHGMGRSGYYSPSGEWTGAVWARNLESHEVTHWRLFPELPAPPSQPAVGTEEQ